jgi:hypothetical protein
MRRFGTGGAANLTEAKALAEAMTKRGRASLRDGPQDHINRMVAPNLGQRA